MSTAGSESVESSLPHPLPPSPPLELSGDLRDGLDRALLTLGRLDSVSTLLPDTALFLYMYVRKEAVLSSQIEGTRSSLSEGRGSHQQPGEFRSSQNWVGGPRPGLADYDPPSEPDVPGCIGDLEKQLHNPPDRTPALLKAVLAHEDPGQTSGRPTPGPPSCEGDENRGNATAARTEYEGALRVICAVQAGDQAHDSPCRPVTDGRRLRQAL